MWRYETDGIHPLRVTFVQTAFDHIQSLENAWISGCMSQLSSSATSSGELRAVTAYECCLQGQTTLQCQETGWPRCRAYPQRSSEFHSLGHQLCRDPILKALRNKETFSSPKLGNNVITFDFSKLSPLQYSQLSPAVQRAYQQYNNILKTEGGYVPPPAAPVIRRGGAPRKVRKGAN